MLLMGMIGTGKRADSCVHRLNTPQTLTAAW